jgi:hypothetical protein
MISPREDVYVDQPWLLMRWDPTHKCIHSEWKGFANSAEFRDGVMRGVQAIRERHATRYVSDTRKVKVVVREDQIWAYDVAAPLMAAAGLKRMAVVTAHTGLGRLTVEDVVRMVDDKVLLVRTFDSVAEAVTWVKGA